MFICNSVSQYNHVHTGGCHMQRTALGSGYEIGYGIFFVLE